MKVSEFTFDSSTAHNKIFTRLYEPDGEPKAVLQISHGMAEHKRMHLRSAAYQLLRNSPTEEAGSACNKILIKHAKSLLSNKHTSVDYLSQVQYT